MYNLDTDQNFGKIVIDDDHRVLNIPGRYRITAIVDDLHYTNACVSCEFNINKVDFPSEILEVYKTYYSFTFNIDHKTIEGYDIGDARIRYIETREEFPVDRESASLRWKEPDKEISTSETTKHTIVLSSSYFNDYEYEVVVAVAKRGVDEPGGLYIDEFDSFKGNSIKYDGEEHTAHVLDLAFFGQYRVNEELSTLKATEKGTYTVVVELVDKENLLWKKTHNNVDLSYTWTIY